MLKLEYDPEFTKAIAEKSAEIVLKGLSAKYAVAAKYPPMLGYKEIMNFFQCGPTKASEIMNIADFPKVPGVGDKKVPIWSLIDWVESHTDYMDQMYPEYKAM